MVNLLSNSLKFTFHGSITVSLTYNEEVEELKVTVSDTGIGIKDEDRELILEMFTHHDAPIICTNTNGPGLELSISSQLVRALGGRIEIE
jgi:signal transduction histidine kinase